jgi:hypothetical protein
MSTPIWLNDPTILLKHNKLYEIWPKSKMTTEEKINAITRLVLLLMLLGYLITLSLKIIYIGFIALLAIVTLYLVQNRGKSKKSKNDKIKEAFSNINKESNKYAEYSDSKVYNKNKNMFSKPTPKNPLMNVLIPEIHYEPLRKPAAPTFNPDVEKEINNSVKEFIKKPFNDDKIGDKLFSDLGDEYMFDRSMLPWAATANTQVPNDQKSFQEYAYGNMISGKEGNPLALERNIGGANHHTLY